MDDGFEAFQEATVMIAEGRYEDAAKLLRAAEERAVRAKPAGPVAEIIDLRKTCEAKLGFGDH